MRGDSNNFFLASDRRVVHSVANDSPTVVVDRRVLHSVAYDGPSVFVVGRRVVHSVVNHIFINFYHFDHLGDRAAQVHRTGTGREYKQTGLI